MTATFCVACQNTGVTYEDTGNPTPCSCPKGAERWDREIAIEIANHELCERNFQREDR